MNYPCPIDISDWPQSVREIVQWDTPPDFGPQKRDLQLGQSLDPTTLLPANSSPNSSARQACWSAILLWIDDLDSSHEVSQAMPGREGSYWHGIMHRREPDYSNAKYWFRKVGSHPIHADLTQWIKVHVACEEATDKLDLDTWSPDRFVDLCQAKAASQGEVRNALKAIAAAEWFLLFHHCWQLKD
jgi:hypothetical protein